MLTNIRIRNFRSCKSVVLDDLTPLVALVGPNGAGKTNVLRAIEWAARNATSPTIVSESVLLPKFPTAVVLEMKIGKLQYSYQIKLHFRHEPGLIVEEFLYLRDIKGNVSRIIERDGEKVKAQGHIVRISSLTPCLSALKAILRTSDALLKRIGPVVAFLETVRYYPFDNCSKQTDAYTQGSFIRDSEYRNWKKERTASPHPVENAVLYSILDMYLDDKKKELYAELLNLLGDKGLGVIDSIRCVTAEFNRINGDRSARDKSYLLEFRPGRGFGGGDEHFRFHDLSAGTRRLIQIIVSVLYDQSSLMLIEHPEDSIHRGLLTKLIGILRAYADPQQVFISSHSPYVFDALAPEDVRLVTMRDGETKVRRLSSRQIKVAGSYIKEDGALSDFLEMIQAD